MAVNREQGSRPQCLVIGGSGFIGQHLVTQLLSQGPYDVSVLDIRSLNNPGIRSVVGDLRQPKDVEAACKGMSVVFHAATAAPAIQNARAEALMMAVNVEGTRHVISACQQQRVPRLVYISSASVVWDGRDLLDVDESISYAHRNPDFYARTKVLGEKLVLEANGVAGLATCALRPSSVYGEHDTLFLPLLVKKATEGKMKYRFGTSIHDWTYAGNIAHACLLADQALSKGSHASGEAFFITDGEPYPFWDFVGDMLEPLGYGRPSISLPALLIYCVAWIFQYIITPLMSPFIALQASEFSANRIAIVTTSRRFNLAKARQLLGYQPLVSQKEAKQKTVKSFWHLQKQQQNKLQS